MPLSPTPHEILQAAAALDPELAVVLRRYYQPKPAGGEAPAAPEALEIPALPAEAWLPDELAANACPWLDAYITFSRVWSPRSFDGYHEACGLWILSTIAARRVKTEFGRARYTPLYLLLAGRSSLYAKSTAANIAISLLRGLQLSYLLAPDQSSPQKFLSLLSNRLPEGYDGLNAEHKELIKKRLGLSGARGWFHEEFGGCINAMMQPSGYMADFRSILRKFDDCPDAFENATQARDLELIQNPYLSLIGNLTPADLTKVAQRGSELWGDGFLARFAIVSPGPDEAPKKGRFPREPRVIPPQLSQPLQEWHTRLGLPRVSISPAPDKTEDIAAGDRVEVCSAPVTSLAWSKEVDDAYYRYLDALGEVARQLENPDLDASYIRPAEKALRIAVLLASLSGSPAVQLPHWARAQAITERWRGGLHALYELVNRKRSDAKDNEDKVLKVIQRHGSQSAAEISRYIRGMGALEAKNILDGLTQAGVLETQSIHRATKYGFPSSELQA